MLCKMIEKKQMVSASIENNDLSSVNKQSISTNKVRT